MDWKELGIKIAKLGLPLLGGALPLPGGAALGTALATMIGKENADPTAILSELTGSAESLLKAKQFELTHQETILRIRVDAELAGIVAVNTTMQAETKAEHWPQYSWRPFNGFIVGVMAFGVYFILPLLHTPIPAIPETVWLMFASILGVASWWRGKEKLKEGDK